MQHYFSENPETAHQEKRLNVRSNGIDFTFKTDSNIFSRHAFDYGSQLLVDSIIADRKLHGRFLDLGCGYGPIGIIMKRVFPHLDLTLADINQRALRMARENLKINAVKYAQVIHSDGLEKIEGLFETISLNPPVRAGKQVIYRLFAEAYAHLIPGGSLYIVIQKKQGAPSAQKALEALSPQVERIARSAGYWVIRTDRPAE